MSSQPVRSPNRRDFLALAGACAGVGVLASPSRADTVKPPKSVIVSAEGDAKTYLLVFDKDQEIMSGLLKFAKDERLVGGSLTAIGAVSGAVLGFFDRKKKDYKRIPINEQAEVVSLTGNVTRHDGKPFLHIHTVLGLPDGTTRGGHLFEAHVWPTLEVVLTGWPRGVKRKRDADTGLELLDP